MWNHFSVALSFLTVFRLPFSSSENVGSIDLARSFSFFPIVGFVLGSCLFISAYLLHGVMPLPLLAIWITALLAFLTRGLHLDGLADMADGVGGGYTRERRLEIMKDSRSGAFGVIVLILALALKAVSIHALLSASFWAPFFLVPALSRFTIVLSAYRMPYARAEGGLGKSFVEDMTRQSLFLAGAQALIISVLSAPGSFWIYVGVAASTAALFRCLSRRWLGGMTGDVLGAVNETTEVVLFSVAACLSYTG
jgi:adenosylcobinamide-GDP ribazoletransferase